MLNIKNTKWLITAMAILSLTGCQTTEETQTEIAKDTTIKIIPKLQFGTPLGGGFSVGMSPQNACLLLRKHYRFKNENNTLCKRVDIDDFTNLTVINKGITHSTNSFQDVQAIAFFFDEYEELRFVMSVEDFGLDYENNRQKSVKALSSSY